MERAGFTEVPVSGMPTRWITASTRPMASPAKPGAASSEVTRSTTNTSRQVSSTSATNAPSPFTVLPQALVPSAPVWSRTPPAVVISFSSPPATAAPTTCAPT